MIKLCIYIVRYVCSIYSGMVLVRCGEQGLDLKSTRRDHVMMKSVYIEKLDLP